tara:strand:- start:103 stop:432 length:330 start_codon:yes stop_codon:yes gene_type:complete
MTHNWDDWDTEKEKKEFPAFYSISWDSVSKTRRVHGPVDKKCIFYLVEKVKKHTRQNGDNRMLLYGTLDKAHQHTSTTLCTTSEKLRHFSALTLPQRGPYNPAQSNRIP